MKQFYKDYLLYNLPFHILAAVAVILLIVAFILPPTAFIDKSVLEATGVLFAFAALYTVIIAIEKGGVGKIKHGNTELEIEVKKEEQSEQ